MQRHPLLCKAGALVLVAALTTETTVPAAGSPSIPRPPSYAAVLSKTPLFTREALMLPVANCRRGSFLPVQGTMAAVSLGAFYLVSQAQDGGGLAGVQPALLQNFLLTAGLALTSMVLAAFHLHRDLASTTAFQLVRVRKGSPSVLWAMQTDQDSPSAVPTTANSSGGRISIGEQIAVNVKATRIARGLSIADLKRRAKISITQLSLFENKRGNLALRILVALARALNVSPLALVTSRGTVQAITAREESSVSGPVIGANLRRLIGDTHESRVRLAAKLGISPNNLSHFLRQIESGHRDPKMDTLELYRHGLDATWADLFGVAETPRALVTIPLDPRSVLEQLGIYEEQAQGFLGDPLRRLLRNDKFSSDLGRLLKSLGTVEVRLDANSLLQALSFRNPQRAYNRLSNLLRPFRRQARVKTHEDKMAMKEPYYRRHMGGVVTPKDGSLPRWDHPENKDRFLEIPTDPTSLTFVLNGREDPQFAALEDQENAQRVRAILDHQHFTPEDIEMLFELADLMLTNIDLDTALTLLPIPEERRDWFKTQWHDILPAILATEAPHRRMKTRPAAAGAGAAEWALFIPSLAALLGSRWPEILHGSARLQLWIDGHGLAAAAIALTLMAVSGAIVLWQDKRARERAGIERGYRGRSWALRAMAAFALITVSVGVMTSSLGDALFPDRSSRRAALASRARRRKINPVPMDDESIRRAVSDIAKSWSFKPSVKEFMAFFNGTGDRTYRLNGYAGLGPSMELALTGSDPAQNLREVIDQITAGINGYHSPEIQELALAHLSYGDLVRLLKTLSPGAVVPRLFLAPSAAGPAVEPQTVWELTPQNWGEDFDRLVVSRRLVPSLYGHYVFDPQPLREGHLYTDKDGRIISIYYVLSAVPGRDDRTAQATILFNINQWKRFRIMHQTEHPADRFPENPLLAFTVQSDHRPVIVIADSAAWAIGQPKSGIAESPSVLPASEAMAKREDLMPDLSFHRVSADLTPTEPPQEILSPLSDGVWALVPRPWASIQEDFGEYLHEEEAGPGQIWYWYRFGPPDNPRGSLAVKNGRIRNINLEQSFLTSEGALQTRFLPLFNEIFWRYYQAQHPELPLDPLVDFAIHKGGPLLVIRDEAVRAMSSPHSGIGRDPCILTVSQALLRRKELAPVLRYESAWDDPSSGTLASIEWLTPAMAATTALSLLFPAVRVFAAGLQTAIGQNLALSGCAALVLMMISALVALRKDGVISALLSRLRASSVTPPASAVLQSA